MTKKKHIVREIKLDSEVYRVRSEYLDKKMVR